jgi:predicted AAA+ superfamily ATPase
MYINRVVTPLISDCLKLFPYVVLLGPRQAGKTTLLSQLRDSWQRY